MTGLLVSREFLDRFGVELDRAELEAGVALERVVLPVDPARRLDAETCERIRIAFFSGDVFPNRSRGFFAALQAAPRLEWLHVFNTGVDHPIFGRFLERGVHLSNSAGTSAEPIAQSVMAGILALSRGLVGWLDAQRRHTWAPRSRDEAPPDLRGQTLVVVGVGSIGREVARIARALGMYVVGVRRSSAGRDEGVDELHAPSRLHELLPRANWLVLSCPLTEQTAGMIDKGALSLLPRGAFVLNVGRGGLLDEAALVRALKEERLGGAYLDVFQTEPLSADSPLWDLPNVILSPHDSAPAQGNERRQAERFFENLVRFGRGLPLEHEVEIQA